MPVITIGSPTRKQRVLETGAFVTPTTASEADIIIHDLSFRFRFTQSTQARVRAEQGGPKMLIINFEGFSNAITTTWQGEVGTFNGESLWLLVSIIATGEEPRQNKTVVYTLCAGALS